MHIEKSLSIEFQNEHGVWLRIWQSGFTHIPSFLVFLDAANKFGAKTLSPTRGVMLGLQQNLTIYLWYDWVKHLHIFNQVDFYGITWKNNLKSINGSDHLRGICSKPHTTCVHSMYPAWRYPPIAGVCLFSSIFVNVQDLLRILLPSLSLTLSHHERDPFIFPPLFKQINFLSVILATTIWVYFPYFLLPSCHPCWNKQVLFDGLVRTSSWVSSLISFLIQSNKVFVKK